MIALRGNRKAILRGLVAGVAVLVAVTGCDRYAADDLELLTAFSAKEMCSCMFVVGQTEDFCRTMTKQAPDVKSVTIDRDAKTVRSQAVMMWGARARYVDKRHGCVLE